MEFVITINNKRYTLPVNPGSLSIKKGSLDESTEVVRLGEVTQFGADSLKEIEFEAYFPRHQTGAISNAKDFKKPEEWVELIELAMSAKKPIRFIVTTTKINMAMSIQGFEHSYKDASNDIYFTLKLKEYREFKAKLIPPPVKPPARPPEPVRPVVTDKITLNCKVLVNGRLYRDSYGGGPGQTEVNATRKVNIIVDKPKAGQKYPYHVATLDGGHRGWVAKESVKRI